jgi:thiaminase (transcriptional activator TenA)
MKFTDKLWQGAQSQYAQIINMPFNQELMKGTLDLDRFKNYIAQDFLYLEDYAKCWSLIISKAKDKQAIQLFTNFVSDSLIAEKSVEQMYINKYGIEMQKVEKNPACFAYTNYLLSTCALASYEEALAAMLPCPWVYQQVGLYMQKNTPAKKNNPYQAWINTYADPSYDGQIQQYLDIVNTLAEETGEKTRKAMQNAFMWSTRLEYMFWDSAYYLATWKI